MSTFFGTFHIHSGRDDKIVQSRVVYAFVRVSDGLNSPDATFATNWAGSRSAGVIHGAYQYFEPAQDPIQQADMVLTAMETFEADDLPPVIDVETTGGLDASGVAGAVQQWIDHVAAAIGRPPIIYTGGPFWDDSVGGANDTSSPLWHAQYTTAACPTIADPWTTWAFWQYTENGTINGIPGASANTDVDRWNGDMASLTAFLGSPGSCGDGTCGPGETPISCPEDCGPCGTIDPQNGFIIDNGDACFQDGGPSAYLRDVTDSGYQNNLVLTHTTDDATESNYATWNLYFAAAGSYTVEAYTAATYAQSKQANYIVTGASMGSAALDQSAADGWQTIGVFEFAQGGHQSIHLGDNTGEPSSGNTQLVFDGIRITPVGSASVGSSGSGNGDGSSDGSSGSADDGPNGDHGGCNTTGSSGAFLALALVGLARRRRRSRPFSTHARRC
jgi:uncharacterized protein (TIGR03382 family)